MIAETLYQVTASSEAVNHPSHYNALPATCSQCGQPIECIDVIENLPFWLGSIIKYVWRHEHKGVPLQDLKKARWYLDRKIKQLEAQGNERTNRQVERSLSGVVENFRRAINQWFKLG